MQDYSFNLVLIHFPIVLSSLFVTLLSLKSCFAEDGQKLRFSGNEHLI